MSPPPDFLSRAMIGSTSSARSPGGACTGSPRLRDERLVVRNGMLVDALERARKLGGEHETDRDRLTVQQRVPGDGLERVGERMPVVQHGARASAFELVRFHVPRLDRRAPGDDVLQDDRMTCDERRSRRA